MSAELGERLSRILMKAPRSQLDKDKMPASKTDNLAIRFFFMCPLYTIFPRVHIKIHEGSNPFTK